jgi:hypothetical protein
VTGADAEWGGATDVASALSGIIKEWGRASVDWNCQREGEPCIASILECPTWWLWPRKKLQHKGVPGKSDSILQQMR